MTKLGVLSVLALVTLAGCGSDSSGGSASPSNGAGGSSGSGNAAGGSGNAMNGGSGNGGSGNGGSGTGSGGGSVSPTGKAAVIAGCPMLPDDHVFNTPIDGLPVDPGSAGYMDTIGSVRIHLDLGQNEDITQTDTYWGIPYNVVHGNSLAWASADYTTTDTGMDWNPRDESDCVVAGDHASIIAPCAQGSAPAPVFPIPASPLVEGGIFPDDASSEYGDHHLLLLDANTCRLWELYHAYTGPGGTWHIFGSATFDLRSNTLRPDTWTSADAAGFPILPLLLRADEASSGEIRHALRFTIDSSSIRTSYTWPARHLTGNGTDSAALPPMGQLFRLKSSFQIPASYGTQSKAILGALQKYGMYLADGGSNLYVQGEPSAKWSDAIFDEVQSVSSDQFEAVDTSPIRKRAGFDPDSGAVPGP